MAVDNTSGSEQEEAASDDEPRDERDELRKNEALEILNNPRRRYVLSLLDTAPDGLTIGELANQVAAWEQDTSVAELTSQQRKRVHVSLYQTHVVKMSDLGVVEFDRDSGLVTLTQKAEQIRQFLPAEDRQRSWQLYYGLFAAMGLVVYLLKLGGVLEVLSWPAVALIVYGGFLLITAGYYYDSRTSSRKFGDLIEEP